MIRSALLAVAIVITVGTTVSADQFQLIGPNGELKRYVPVVIKELDGRVITTRHTDRIGRFNFDRRGSFLIEVDGQSTTIQVTGETGLKRKQVP